MKRSWKVALVAALVASTVLPASATTLERAGLERLVEDSSSVVLGEVVDVHSYWSAGGDAILTDIRVARQESLKGDETGDEVVFTVPGGTVGDMTHLIVAAPSLVPGNTYVLFLGESSFPGAPAARAALGLVQGVFDVRREQGELRAVSQASGYPLLPDSDGLTEPPGASQGLALDRLKTEVRSLVQSVRPEVRR